MLLLESKADMARRKGVTRGAVSLACRPGGALHAALVHGDRINRAHPAALKWLGECRIDDETMTAAEVSEATGIPLAEVEAAFAGELRKAVLPGGLVGAATFAALSGERLTLVLRDLEHELLPAVTPSRHIDVMHPAALAYVAKRPFVRGDDGDPIVPEEFPGLPSVGDEGAIDIDDPVVRVFTARCLGRVPTDADFGLGEPAAE